MKKHTFDSNIGPITVFELDHHIIEIVLGGDQVYKDEPTKVISMAKEQLLAYLSGNLRQFTFPYFADGSQFEQSVLSSMKDIPYGEKVSYKQLAINTSNANAYRAVGTVCKKNKLPILFPCHRVIKSDGSIGQYSGGTQIKKKLLSLEKHYKSN